MSDAASSSAGASGDPPQPAPRDGADATSAPEAGPSSAPEKPIVLIMIGMAGSGKTTLMQRLNAHFHLTKTPSYVINLDPAAVHAPATANIDIRDTVDYKAVMKQYNLGPNGGILTSLNLFATRFDQVLGFVEKRASEGIKYILMDTPGQIEIFTWSASGAIITESLASTLPVAIVYVVDTVRSANPTTFMSNMMYACSVMYKTQLPFICVFNKIDVVSHKFATEWMQDYDAFCAALDNEKSYSACLTRSMSLVLDEFYKNIRTVGVSAVSGEGISDFLAAVDDARKEYWEVYRPHLERKMAEREKERAEEQMAKLSEDMPESEKRKGKTKAKK
eukprot:tig00020614_g12214.t1